MDEIRIIPGPGYAGEGISEGLARGLLVYYGDCHLTGEGMGIGSIALRDQKYTYFSRTCSDSVETGVLKRTFSLDTRMRWSIRGEPSELVTRGIESCIGAYMHVPRLQKLLIKPVFPLRTLLGIHPVFETVPSRGEVTFAYRVSGNAAEVHAEINVPATEKYTFCLLNELSAAWFTAGWDGKQPVSPPPGWEEVSPDRMPVSLVDPVHGIRFFLDQPSVMPPVPVSVYRGRELNGDHCWAGFCIQLDIPRGFGGVTGVQYRISFASGAW